MSSAQGTVEWTPHDLLALGILAPLLTDGGYLPWSSGAMRASALVTICNEIVLGSPRRILELGAGASTLLLARLLRERDDGARLDAVEHDAHWATWVTERLAAEQLSSVVTVTLAALEPHPAAWDGLPWYADGPLAATLQGEPIDLLVVDGPPAHDPAAAHARYPALPVVGPHLAPGAVVVLDDVLREGETDIVTRWEHETAFRFERRTVEGIALGRDPTRP